MFRTTSCSSSEESIVSIQYLVYVTLVDDRFVCRSERNEVPFRPAHETVIDRVTYTRYCIDTIDSSDDEHEVARNMWRIKVNT